MIGTGNFWCTNCTCGASNIGRKFQIEVITKKDEKRQVCPNNDKLKLKHLGYKMLGCPITTRGQHKKGRTPKERYERRTKHFRKEILPTMSGFDRKYFEKKLGKPL